MKLFLFVVIVPVLAYADMPVDSSRNYKMNEFVVTGQRMTVDVVRLPTTVQIIDSQMISTVSGNSVGDVLKLTPGIFMRSYGGGGALQSVSLRGMGPDYSLILVDGIRFTTSQIGTVDLGIFSLNDVERIEIATGGNSAAYGADAVGGIVNIITKLPQEGFSLSAGSEIGSFGMSSLFAGGNFGIDGFSTRTTVRRERARNNYGFLFDDGVSRKVLTRSGSDYSLLNASVNTALKIPYAELRMSLRYNNADRGQPYPVTSEFQNNQARLNDDDIMIGMQAIFTAFSSLTFSFASSFRNYVQQYTDPTILLAAYYKNIISQIAPQIQWTIGSGHTVTTGFEYVCSTIRSNELKESERKQLSLFATSQHTFELPLEVILYPSVRYDSFSDVKGALSHKLGINIGLSDEPIFRLRSSYGKNYRVPTFNDLYWIVGGNPDLTPERSVNFDIGILTGFEAAGLVEIEANYFSIEMKDKIVWLPVSGNIWSPKNVSEVSSSGLELRVYASLFEKALTLQYAHQFTRAIQTSGEIPNDAGQNKYLAYTPREHSIAVISYSFGPASVSFVHAFTGYRFETQDNNPRFVLSSYTLTDINASYYVPLDPVDVILKVSIKNLFDTKYEIISDFPTPLRSIQFSIQCFY